MAHDPLPRAVRDVLDEFPGTSVVRAHQVARDRKLMRAKAARQARRNLFGELPAGGIGERAHALLASFDALAPGEGL